jgi:cytochrome d ubiquinol oxidase subunit II
MLRHPLAVLLGLVHVCLSILLGALYVIRVVDDHAVRKQMRRTVHILSVPLMTLSIVWVVFLMLRVGFSVNSDGVVSMEKYKYLMTVLHYRPVQAMFILGAVLFAGGLYFGVFTKSRRKGFWLTGAGTVFVVMGIFFLAGFNGTAYFPSLTDLQSSLTIQNSSADFGTLELLSWVSPIIPVAVIGLGWLWHRADHKKKITVRRMLREEGRR